LSQRLHVASSARTIVLQRLCLSLLMLALTWLNHR